MNGPVEPRPTDTPLPDLEVLLAGLRVVAIPMRVPLPRGDRPRGRPRPRALPGWGEFSPFLEYAPAEASRWLASAVESGWAGWPAPLRYRVPVNATVPAVPPSEVAGVLARFDGCTTAKVKVAERGQSLDDDVARVAAVRDAMGPRRAIRVDANGGWDVDEALDGARRARRYGLEYAEQPVRRRSRSCASCGWRLARTASTCPSPRTSRIRKAEDPLRVRGARRADLIVVKVAPLGGVRARAADRRRPAACPPWCRSALDTSVGMAGRGRARRRPARARPRLRAGHGRPARRRRHGAPARARWRRALAVGRVAADPALLEPLGGPRRARRLVARAGGGLPRDPRLRRLTTGLPLPARNTVGA